MKKLIIKELKDNLKILSKASNKYSNIKISICTHQKLSDCVFSMSVDNVKCKQQFLSIEEVINEESINIELKLTDFKKTINSIKNKLITIDVVKKYLVIDNTKLKIQFSESEYKIDKKNEVCNELILTGEYFARSLSKCIFYSKETSRPALQGINFYFKKDELILASTDGRVLNKENMQLGSSRCDFEKILTVKVDSILSFLELRKIKKVLNGTITLKLYEDCIIFNFDGFCFKFDVIDSKYPNIEQVMPDFEDNKIKKIIFSKKEAIDAIKQLSYLCKENRDKNLYLKMKNKKIIFYGIDEKNDSNVKNSIDASYDCKEDTIICFNYKYLLDVLSVCEKEKVELNCLSIYEGEKEGMLLTFIKENHSIYLIVRIKILNNDYHSDRPFSDIKNTLNKIDNEYVDSKK